ncbi:hypothetical protein K502DRAFT_326223 [Neoconidiobolus thromboides FSU 785]|nr:hypothetical protein K502DRAFT_326223 [Neoconidiobolus thromboides FSU 785]
MEENKVLERVEEKKVETKVINPEISTKVEAEIKDSSIDDDIREELIDSAVNFLTDKNVKKSSLNKKVAFLESKGLTNIEIQEALARANASNKPTKPQNQSQGQSQDVKPTHHLAPPLPSYSSMPPALPPKSMSWLEYFKASAVTGAVAYSIYGLTKTFIAPLFIDSDDELYEREKKELDSQYEEAFKAISELKQDTEGNLKSIQEQNVKVEESLKELNTTLKNLKDQDQSRYLDMEKLWEEIENVKKKIPETFDLSHQSQKAMIEDLKLELTNLKNSLNKFLNKDSTPDNENIHRSNSFNTIHSNSLEPEKSEKPIKKSIPAWQLSMFNANKSDKINGTENEDKEQTDSNNSLGQSPETIEIEEPNSS